MKVVFLGLGIMGKAMSMNLLKNGFKVTAWNRTLSKSKFVALKLCDCNVMNWWLMVPWFDKPQQKWLRSVRSPLPCCLILLLLFRGKGYIDMSTVDPETSCKISEAITSKGGQFLEAPVSGSKQPAEAGQLVILAAEEKMKQKFDALEARVSNLESVPFEESKSSSG